MPQISIIIPVYKVENHIAECLQSIQSQTFQDFECILVDDGSPDRSIEVAKSVVDSDKRFIFLHKENGGVSSARNLGLKHAKGDWIVFIDSDDKVNTTYLSDLLLDLEKNQVDFVIQNFFIYANDNQPYSLYKNPDKVAELPKFLESDIFIYGHLFGKLFKKSIVEDLDLTFDTQIPIHEDLIFFLSYLRKVKSIYLSSQKNYHYLYHEGSLTKKSYPPETVLYITQKVYDSCKNLGAINNPYLIPTIGIEIYYYFGSLIQNKTYNSVRKIREGKNKVRAQEMHIFRKYAKNKTKPFLLNLLVSNFLFSYIAYGYKWMSNQLK